MARLVQHRFLCESKYTLIYLSDLGSTSVCSCFYLVSSHGLFSNVGADCDFFKLCLKNEGLEW